MPIHVQHIALVPSREFTDIVGQRLGKGEQVPEWNEFPERNQMNLVVSRSPVAVGQDQLRRIEHLGLGADLRAYSQTACDYICMRIL